MTATAYIQQRVGDTSCSHRTHTRKPSSRDIDIMATGTISMDYHDEIQRRSLKVEPALRVKAFYSESPTFIRPMHLILQF